MNNKTIVVMALAVSLFASKPVSTAFGKDQYPAAHVASPDVYK